jgi:hypothetical protein
VDPAGSRRKFLRTNTATGQAPVLFRIDRRKDITPEATELAGDQRTLTNSETEVCPVFCRRPKRGWPVLRNLLSKTVILAITRNTKTVAWISPKQSPLRSSGVFLDISFLELIDPDRGGSASWVCVSTIGYNLGFAQESASVMRKSIWRAVIEVGFIIFLFYSNLLMGEFERSGMGQRNGVAWAIGDVFTAANFEIAMIAALSGYAIFEFLRKKF